MREWHGAKLLTAIKTASPTKRLLTALLVVVPIVGALTAVLTRDSSAPVATPMIVGRPINPTTAANASFVFTDAQAGVHFECSLDGASFNDDCPSPKIYPGPLIVGPHTFHVRARNADGDASSNASAIWTITPNTPPAPTITAGPANGTNARSANFSFTDARAAVSYRCRLDHAAFAVCASPTSYAALAAGSHTFAVKAVDTAGTGPTTSYTWLIDGSRPSPATTVTTANARNATLSFTDTRAGAWYVCRRPRTAFALCTSAKVSAGWLAAKAIAETGTSPALPSDRLIDRRAPGAPVITSGPADPTVDTTATFAFTEAEAGAGMTCNLDNGAFVSCISGQTYIRLTVGSHTFTVRATDPAGNVSPSVAYTWTIHLSTTPQVGGFTISGNLLQPLFPGTISALDVRVANPFDFAIDIAQLTVSPEEATTRYGQPNPACRGTTNLVANRQYRGSTLTIAKHSTESLAELGIPSADWPQLEMPNLSTNQDACKSTTFTFGYAADATKTSP